uniref:tripartite tricarboxylate transporter permease n=1 Tax=Azospirillum agricola TaxID=1720247 RepID=UPI001FFFFEB4|nr:tripartite tricarboxylate transporter permease [Azospirillum agricola]
MGAAAAHSLRLLYPAILLFACIGIYSVGNSAFDVGLAAAFGLLGYILVKAAFEPAPLLLGFILGPLMEENLRRAMTMSRGDAGVFLREPVSLGLLLLASSFWPPRCCGRQARPPRGLRRMSAGSWKARMKPDADIGR